MLGLAVAVRVDTSAVPPILKVEPLPWVKVPVPVSEVVTVRVLLLVKLTPVTVRVPAALTIPPLVGVPVPDKVKL